MALQKGLVGHWTMNSEDTDNGKIRDRSAYGNHGTLNGGVTTGQTSPIGDAYQFDGNDDQINLGSPNVFNMSDGSGTDFPMTISGWANISSSGKINFLSKAGPNTTDWEYYFKVEGNIIRFRFYDYTYTGSNQNRISKQYKNFSKFNTWTHLAVTYDGSKSLNGIQLYINGQPVSATDTEANNYSGGRADVSNLRIGVFGLNGSYEGWSDGKASDIRLYNRVLSQSEINQLYNKRTTVGGAVQGITAEVYDTQSYYNSNPHPSNKSGLDQFFDTTNSGVAFEKARVHNRPHIFFGNSNQNAGIGNVNSYPYYITTGDKDGYAWKIESSFVAPETGTYTFGVDSDDASDVLIDGNVIASYYGGHGFSGGVSNHTGTVNLTQGNQYDFAARFEEGSGGDGIAVAWQKPSDSSLSKFPLDILTPIQT